MQKRLNDYCTENNVISANQCGFQIDNNIFILNSVVQRYIHYKNKNLFVVFVELKKYCINKEMLFYKLQKYGINGNFYQVTKSTILQLSSATGVKQGCNLSSLLSYLYQNDLHDIFDDTCDPVKLGNMHVNSLSWADDLILQLFKIN